MKYAYPLIVLMIIWSSCSPSRRSSASARDDGKIELVFVQVNDVYEIAPVSAGKYGGLARVAALKKQELALNPNSFLVMAGDFLSPSVYNSLVYEGKRVRGKQMVEAMNAAGFDYAVFGNHEFDVLEAELQDRINEARFHWLSSNTFHKTGDSVVPFVKNTPNGAQALPLSEIITVKDADGTTARIGVIGATIPSNKAGFVQYTDPLETARELYNQISGSCDAVVAITHQTIREDIRLAEQLPGLALIMGGHEHDQRYNKTGNVYITKAHSNARSAYVIKLAIDKIKKSATVTTTLKPIDATTSADSATETTVKKWKDIAEGNYASIGFDPSKIIIASGDSLEGRDVRTRSGATNLTDLVLSAMAYACPAADMVISNAGAMRLDDVLYPPVTEYDILRTLPFGGVIREVDMKGKLLMQILAAGSKNKTGGGFLHYHPQNMTIDLEKIYRIGLAGFLLTGAETNLNFLKTDNPDIVKAYDEQVSNNDPRSDIRLAIIRYLQHTK